MQRSDDKNGSNKGFAASAARGLVAGIAVMLILFAVFAALVSSGRVPESVMNILLFAAAFLGCFAGSIMAVKSHGLHVLAMSLTVSGVLFLMTLVGAAFSEEGGLVGPLTPGLLLALLAGGILGSLLCVRKKGRRRA